MKDSKPKRRRSKFEVAGEQLERVAMANKARQERLIDENLELQERIRDLQSRYQFPVQEMKDWNKWYFDRAEQDINTIIDFQNEVHRLAMEYGVEEFEERIKWTVVLGKPLIAFYGMGFPACTENVDGKWEIKITDTTQINNPIVQEYIRSLTLSNTLRSDPPPEPHKDTNNRGKLDWRPVYEWNLRHPEFTYAEIAQALKRSARTVENKLLELKK